MNKKIMRLKTMKWDTRLISENTGVILITGTAE